MAESKKKKDGEADREVGQEDLADYSSELFAQLEKEKQQYFNGWQREKADFINYKNKEIDRFNDLSEALKQDFVLKLLPVLDNFSLAEKAINGDKQQDQNIKGLLMIKFQLESALKEQGLELLTRLGKKFDPSLDEVVEVVESEEVKPDTVVEEVQRGYCLNGKLLRPAKVKISRAG